MVKVEAPAGQKRLEEPFQGRGDAAAHGAGQGDGQYEIARNYVGGRWIDPPPGAALLDVIDPATGQPIAKLPLSTKVDVEAAVAAAQAAFPAWRATPPIERVRYLFRLRDRMETAFEDLARIVTQDHGKTLDDARGEVRRAIENVETAAGIPTLMMGYGLEDGAARNIDEHVIRQPLGVFAAICPFNFPLMVPFWFWPYAIACGNTYIVKPSEQVPLALLRIFELLEEVGLPAGVMNLVQGARETVDALLDEPRIQGISFVGSSPVARYIYSRAAANGKRVQAQGGAKNHLVVMPDAVEFLDAAVPNILGACFGAAGQRCLAGSMLLTVGAAHGPAVEKIVAAAKQIKVGNGLEPGIELGPVISAAARDRIVRAIDEGAAGSATLLLDGRAARNLPGCADGYFVGPTIFDGVKPDDKLAQDEIFGPVLGIDNVATLDDAMQRINASPFGNAASVYTRSGKVARDFRYNVVAGNIGVNVGVAAPMAYFPFAGMKGSFYGTLHGQGRDAVEFFTDKKVYIERWL
jgi:malonate-semialdehyde dehydrogenase (acetylating)/methylmalonate-semialdehyde dehydrogenase